MKKLKLFALGLIGVSTLTLTSCADDSTDDPAVGPLLTVTEANVGVDGGTIQVTAGTELQMNWEARKGDIDLEGFRIEKDGDAISVTTDGGEELPVTNLSGDNEDLYVDSYTFNASMNLGTTSYTFVATDEDGLSDEVTVDVEVVAGTTPLSQPESFTWKREGGDPGTGLDQFGLAWENNTSTNAIVKTDAAEKMVILNSAAWTGITTVQGLSAAVEGQNGVTEYTGVSVQQDDSYDDVIGVKLDADTYYLIHVTNGEVSTAGTGTTITVTGEYKE